jgi:hypothetical protein
MNKLKAGYNGLSNKTKAAWHSAWISALGVFLLGITGWLAQVAAWATDSSKNALPDFSVLAKLVVALTVGVVSGAINLLYRAFVKPPEYQDIPPAKP